MTTLLAALLRNESGGRNIANTTQGTSSGQAQGYFQITTGTWADFGGTKYAATPLDATYAQQAEIASQIPLKRWDSSTLAAMRATGNPIDPNQTLGQNLAMNGETFGSDASTAPSPEPLQYVPITDNPANGSPDNGAGPLSWSTPADDPRWKDPALDLNGDGEITVNELKAYNATAAAAKAAGGGSSGQEGKPTDVPTAIVTGANQQSQATLSAAQTQAKTDTANTAATNATNVGIWQGLQTWLGGRLLQIMVFVIAAIFLLVGLYMFTPKGTTAAIVGAAA